MSALGTEDLSKEQIAFVSGTVLAWGALLMKFWPIVAQMQTGKHAHALPQGFVGTIAPMAVIVHRLAALVLALGVAMLLFGTLHVMARGLSLARVASGLPSELNVNITHRIAERTYTVIQVYWISTIFALLAMIFAIPIVLGLTRVFHWQPIYAIAAPGVFLTAIVTTFNLRRRRRAPGTKHPFLKRFGTSNVLIAIAAMFVLWPMVMELSYTAELHVSQPVMRHSQSSLIMVSVTLGGAVSDPKQASLSIIQDAKLVRTLDLKSLGNGSYVALTSCDSRPEGDYEVRLTYPHTYIAVESPTFSSMIEKRVGFIVAS